MLECQLSSGEYAGATPCMGELEDGREVLCWPVRRPLRPLWRPY
jgi:hypothetical protein